MLISLVENSIGAVFVYLLFKLFSKPTSLRECFLDENDISDLSALFLFQFLPELQVLSLHLNLFPPKTALHLPSKTYDCQKFYLI